MNQGTDYYAVLGVHPQASLTEIRRAFRRRARTTHPDAGGTHEGMVLLAEAWATLSDPDLRAAYDRQRDARRTPGDIATWEAASERVRAEAERYPKDVNAFRAWLDALGADASRATYGSAGSGWFSHATISGSWSGTVVMLACVGLAYLLAYRLLGDAFRAALRWHPGEFVPGDPSLPVVRRLLTPLFMLTVPMAVSSWAAVRLHRLLRRRMLSRGDGNAAGRGRDRPVSDVRAETQATQGRVGS